MAIIVAGSAITILGAIRIGVSVDEGFHVLRLRNYFTNGWYLLDDDLVAGVPGGWVEDRWVYAPVTTLLLHLLNVVMGNESAGQVSASASAYAVRHVGTAVIGLVGVAAVAATTRRLMHSWRWGVVAAGVLLMIPMWSGHAMINVKDLPAATAYMLVTLGCVRAWQSARDEQRTRMITVVVIVAGLVLAVGTRPALWPGPVSAIGVVVLASLWRGIQPHGRAWWRCLDLTLCVVAAAVVLGVIYPSVFLHPDKWIIATASESSGAGGSDPPLAYIPLMVMTTIPVVVLLMGSAGLLLAAKESKAARPELLLSVPMFLVCLQTFLIPTLIMLRGAPLSGLLRHVLFACPTAAILLTAGIAATLHSVRGRVASAVVGPVLAVGLLIPMAVQVQLFPYSYSYVNEIADVAAIDFAPDYWRASYRELLADVPTGEFVVCSPAVTDEGRALRRMEPGGQSLLALGADCRTAPGSVIEPYVESPPEIKNVADTFISLQQVDPDALPKNCSELGRVERRRHLVVQVVSIAARCSLMLESYAGPISVDGGGEGAKFLLGGWSGNGGDPWIETAGSAHIGFTYPGGASGQQFRVMGTATGSVQILVNNDRVTVTETTTGWEFSPVAVDDVGDPDNVVVSVLPLKGSVRLTAVEIVDPRS